VIRVLVDTSAVIALANPSDIAHKRAARTLLRLQAERAVLITTSYVLHETYSLLGRRHGLQAVRSFRQEIAPLLSVQWVDPCLHEAGLDYLLSRPQRRLSLTDAVSILAATEERVDEVFAFDQHFRQAGLPLSE